MPYTSIRTQHSVGDTVYFYDPERDSVQRAKVIRISATADGVGYSPDFSVTYALRREWANAETLSADMVVTLPESQVKDTLRDAFPPIPPEAEEPPTA